jgi:N-formylglutamate amidohydrolase
MPAIGILHVPHNSTVVPCDLRTNFVLTEDLLRREILKMTDWYTSELFSVPHDKATTICFPVSRLIVDPERFLDDDFEPMAVSGMGVIYTRTADGRPLRMAPSPAERDALISRFYHPHHQMLANTVRLALNEHGTCVIVDCHSFPSVALPCDLDQAPDRRDICIGTDPFHTPDWLLAHVTARFVDTGLSVDVNRPYSGAIVPAEYYRRQAAVSSIMIEVNRRLYIDEDTGEKRVGFADVAHVVQRLTREIISLFRRR